MLVSAIRNARSANVDCPPGNLWRCWPSRRRRGTGRCSGRGCCCLRRRDWRIFGSLIRCGEPGYGHGVAVAVCPAGVNRRLRDRRFTTPAPSGPNRAWPTQQRISCDRWCLMTKPQPQPPAPPTERPLPQLAAGHISTRATGSPATPPQSLIMSRRRLHDGCSLGPQPTVTFPFGRQPVCQNQAGEDLSVLPRQLLKFRCCHGRLNPKRPNYAR